ncbi:uncharacterized protein BO95DRAFT_383326 [Aspergillus brunneoviolaceus CBS 621.78]|uniref:Uncharacterized protein n=1 Tax=Aspergillus brunneoviolaceus CBS 621.78 TaxID=1450534 RepID=A0ACD1GHI6_9EURO|nr:hypothetical protein BO95DRAFT_383326 [Aspergillus brunneoviolaceus CBS 621.78]RAH48625.1 hypothetical protein BO95DRAFT_383326 [Aspergillus brunneoviolaceus CBS 621.78]
MPRDADFLSPRELLVNDGFVCKLASFRKLGDLCIKNERLPDSDDSLMQQAGFENKAYNVVLPSYLQPIPIQFQTVRQVANNLNGEYNYTETVCSTALKLCSAASDDYDKIFQDMEALRQDPDNDNLRDKVQQEITDRKYQIDILKDQADAWSSNLRTYSLDAEDCETNVRQLAAPFQGTTLADILKDEISDPEDLQMDLDALDWTKNLLENFAMIDDLQDSLQEVQKMAGAAYLIADDIDVLLKYVEDHLDPGDNPLDGLVQATLLRKWKNLENDVNDFLDAYKQ